MEQKTNHSKQKTEEQKQLLFLVQMILRRKEHPAINADIAWQRFAAIHGIAEGSTASGRQTLPKRRLSPIHLWLSAVGGAAAACVIMFIVQQWMTSAGHSPYVALHYDATAQQLCIGEHDTVFSAGQERFLSFYDTSEASRGTASTSVTSHTETSTTSPHTTYPKSEASHPVVKTRKLSTPRGMDFRVLLPDSSEVWLNAESTIEFPVAFNSGERRVELHGEAYFKVTRNEQTPFVVHTDRLKVCVLGTEFNLRAYDTDASSLTLVKGSVQVFSEKDKVLLSPGQEVECTRTGSLRVHDIDTYSVTQWTEGLFYFDEMPLVEVLKELGRWYNLGVVFHHQELMEMKIHFSASRTDDIDTAIRNLNRLRKVRITIEEEYIVVY